MNILLFIHIVLALILIAVILLQRTSVDGVSSLAGSNAGLMSGQSVDTFLTRTTAILATLFLANSIVLANLSTSKGSKISDKIQQEVQREQKVPIAK